MMLAILTTIGMLVIAIGLAYYLGRLDEKKKSIEKNLDDGIKAKKRMVKRATITICRVRERLLKFSRCD